MTQNTMSVQTSASNTAPTSSNVVSSSIYLQQSSEPGSTSSSTAGSGGASNSDSASHSTISHQSSPSFASFQTSSKGPLPSSSSSWQSPASNSVSVSTSIPSSTQVLPAGATVITSTLPPSGSISSSRVISETFIPTTYSSLTGLTSTLTTSSIISFGTSSTTAIPVTVYPGGSAWGVPSVGPGTPIFPAPSVAPNVGLPSSTQFTSSGFTTSFTSSPWADLPASKTSEPQPLDDLPASSVLAGLTTFTGTTSPTVEYISTGVSSDSHSPTNHPGGFGFPIFWGHSHFCFVRNFISAHIVVGVCNANQRVQIFCPSHGHCLLCGFLIDLPPGIYPPGSIEWPPGWTEPDITITIDEDGTPTYDEDEEPTTTSTTTTTNTDTSASTSQPLSTSVSWTSSVSSSISSVSSSATSSGGFLCAPTCSACANVAPPPTTDPYKRKRHLRDDLAPKDKRMLDWPDNAPYYGWQDYFIWQQFVNTVIATVGLRNDAQHPSSAMYYPLLNQPFGLAVTGLYGCTSLIVTSTKGVWLSHFWENPSFNDPTLNAAQQQARFQQQILSILGPGDGTPLFPGLSQFMGPNGAFAPDTNVQVIIVTPQNRYNPVPGVMMYASMAQQIAATVTQLFGGDLNTGDHGNMAGPAYYITYAPNSNPITQRWTTTGKVLFQYDPVQARCINANTGEPAQFAIERIWLESVSVVAYEYYWPVWPFQSVPDPNQQGSKRRDFLSNGTEDQGDSVYLGKRQESWTPGVQPSVYPSCFSELEHTATGAAEATAVLVGPNGPVNGPSGGAGGASGLTSSTTRTTTGVASITLAPSASAASIASVSSVASVAAASYAMTTSNPLCTPLYVTPLSFPPLLSPLLQAKACQTPTSLSNTPTL